MLIKCVMYEILSFPIHFDKASAYNRMESIFRLEEGCHLPFPDSYSSHGFFVSGSVGNNNGVVVVIAAKCIAGPLSFEETDKDVAAFNKIFEFETEISERGSIVPRRVLSKRKREERPARKNILLIFSTGGFSEHEPYGTRTNGVIRRAANFQFRERENPNVNHVILVNLKESETREEFFNIQGKLDLCQNLQTNINSCSDENRF
jgi:hypothetical protein